MSYEDAVATLLRSDTTLGSILTGGIYAAGVLGDIGITDPRTTGDAYSGGLLKPLAVVKERAIVPTFEVMDFDQQWESARQMVGVWMYAREATGYGTLDSAGARIRTLLYGATLNDSYELRLAQWLKRERAPELIKTLLARQDWQVDFIQQ
jgi:hypothetical protein